MDVPGWGSVGMDGVLDAKARRNPIVGLAGLLEPDR